ncbi:MAG: hypothetical protein R3A79_00805 [Nannocystaceae bacterium]
MPATRGARAHRVALERLDHRRHARPARLRVDREAAEDDLEEAARHLDVGRRRRHVAAVHLLADLLP